MAHPAPIAEDMGMADIPVMCTLTPDALQTRREGLLAQLLRDAESHDEVPDGHRLQFVPGRDTLTTIARVIDAERRCCRFLRFTVTVEPGDGPIVLELTGPAGTREFVASLLEP